ncbi:CRE-VHP-1 protein [Caenorhabditis remanei]|uniref:protein-tyrosine-phosphatase n=1 Tax=Caenorhabditis remanei TaxID=31234 RepID=E3M4I9_CAERE|nr:CRE-VHP-1 protein [Caenorhabditis remanei]
MTVLDTVTISTCGLSSLIREAPDTTLIVDCRGFTEYNESHVRHSMNAFFSKLIRRRLFENKLDDNCLIHQLMSCSTPCFKMDEKLDLVLYAEEDKPRGNKRRIASCNAPESTAKIMRVLRERLEDTDKFRSVMVLEGGFKQFAQQYPQLCESSEGMTRLPQSLSQPCLSQPTGDGITLITPNIYLGSQMDSLDETMLKALDISVVINLSMTCPKSVCIKEEKNFMRIPVNDSYQEKLSPYFPMAYEFLERCRKAGKKCLIHCLAGISRSPTLCISYIMRHMKMGSDDAYRYVKERRPSISPNFNFMGQLLEYENVLIKDHVLRHDQASRPHRHIDYYGSSDLCPPKVPKSASSHCVFPGSTTDDSSSSPSPSSPSVSEGSVVSEPEQPTTSSDSPSTSTSSSEPETSVTVNQNGKRNMTMDMGLPHRPKALGLPSRIGTSVVELPSPSTELSRLSFDGPEALIPSTPILNFTNPCFTSPIAPVAPSSRETLPTLPIAASSSSSSSVSSEPSFEFSSFESSSSSSIVVENPFFASTEMAGSSSGSMSSGSQSSSASSASRCRMKGFFKVFSKKASTTVSTPTTSSSSSGISRATRPECLRSSGIIISAPVLATTEEEDAESPESGFNEPEVGDDEDSVSICSTSSLELPCQ